MNRTSITVALVGLVAVAVVAAPLLQPQWLATPAGADEPVYEMSVEPKPPPQATVVPTGPGARVEVVFVLDTTSSMSGLIEGAKETIWSVVNDFSSQEPRPEVVVGLVAYRDRGDAYVTQSFSLTDDLDEVYAKLRSLDAVGGGDAPESVVKGLVAAVDEQPWSQGERVFRSIFLVGDAPDKAYADEPSPAEVVARARARDIYVNAIQCGTMSRTGGEFRAIAKAGEGVFRAVAQDGAVERLVAPHDAELDRLQRQLNETALPWGSRAERADTSRKMELYESASASTKASRLSVLSKTGGKVVTSKGRGDLLDDLAAGKVALTDIPVDQLPAALAGLEVSEQQAEVDKRFAERKALQASIDEVVAKRDAWVVEERRKRPAPSAAYDREVVGSSLEKMEDLGLIE